MGEVPTLTTDRLVLRPWRPTDRAPWAALNADPEVMALMPSLLTRAEADAFAARIEAELAERGWGLWAVEVPGHAGFVGFVGLHVPGFAAPFTPCVEVGWRLARAAWGRGYATEGATAVLDHAWAVLGLDEVVSFTSEGNLRSRAVMERLGMTRDPADDFDHPNLPEGHRLRRHVLYRLPRPTGAR